MNAVPIKVANITLGILLAIALLPAIVLSQIQQAWAGTNDEGVYALYYRDTDSDTYTLIIQNSDEDYSQGAYGELDPTKTYAICSDTGCKCDEWNNTALSGRIVKVVTQKVENGKVSTYGKLPAIHSMDSWFRGLGKCESIDLKALDTSKVTCMVRAFMNCSSLTEIELDYLDTSNVDLMTAMFEGCSSLKYFDSSIDTSKVEYMGSMFSGCSSMTNADLSSFDTSNLQDMSSMFYDCRSLRTVDLSSFDTTQFSDVADLAGGLFENCFHLSKVTLGERSALGKLLPTPSSQYIENATGSWKNQQGQVFAVANIPAYTQGTYTAEIAQGNTSAKPKPNPVPVNPPAATKPSTPQAASLAKASAKTTISSATYYGRPLCPGVIVKLNGKTLQNGTDYTVSYKNNKNVGTATVTITGKGAYSGTKTATFKIVPKGTSVSKLTKGKRAFTVKWKKPSKANLKQTTGYQIRWSTAKSMKGAKSKTVKAASSAGKKCQLKVAKLKGGKKYYVQVRTYKKAGGKTYYSSWSKAKTVTTKK